MKRPARSSTTRRRASVGAIPAVSEAEAQKTLFKLFDLLRVRVGTEWLPLSEIAYAVPNGIAIAGTPKQRGMYMASLKAQGFKPGVSDIVIPVPTAAFHGLYLELKKDKTSAVADDQVLWRDRMRALGYRAEIIAGYDAAAALVREYLSGMYSTVPQSPSKGMVI